VGSGSGVDSHRDLLVWQKAMDLVVLIYGISEYFPVIERYRLTDQLTRAAASVPANIAQGNVRASCKDYAHFVSIARGSLMETETFVMLARRLAYISEERASPALSAITEISKMLTSLRNKLTAIA